MGYLHRPMRVALPVAALVLTLAGCGASEISCPAVTAQVPATAESGSTVHVELANLWASCDDQGGRPVKAMDAVEIEVVAVSTSEPVITTGRADVAQDGTAGMDLTIPDDTTGWLKLVLDGVTLETLTISE